jgi:hypothetical protein
MTLRQNVYAAWKDGDVVAIEALRSLCADYEELDSTYRDFEKMREHTRAQMSEVVATLEGEKIDIPGFGSVRLTQATTTQRYDAGKLDELATHLAMCGLSGIADRILECKEMGMRAGSLRIEREKPRTE